MGGGLATGAALIGGANLFGCLAPTEPNGLSQFSWFVLELAGIWQPMVQICRLERDDLRRSDWGCQPLRVRAPTIVLWYLVFEAHKLLYHSA